MKKQRAWGSVVLILAVTGCASTQPAGVDYMDSASRIGVGGSTLIANNSGGLIANNSGGLIANNSGGLIANNAGALTGVIRGPAAGLVANNAAGIVAGNSAGLIANNSAGLVAGNSASYRVKSVDQLTLPVAGIEVAIYDHMGAQISTEPVITNANGEYYITGLKPSGPLVYVKAVYEREGHRLDLVSAASAPRDPGVHRASVDPATTLVAKKVDELVRRGAVAAQAVKSDALNQIARTLGAVMNERAVVAASVQPIDEAAKTFDRMLKESSALGSTVSTIVVESQSADVTSETPVQAAAQPTPTPLALSGPGAVTMLAGNGTPGYTNGEAGAAQFHYPYSVAVDGSGNTYVADMNNHRIRKVTADGVVSTLAGGEAGFADGAGEAAQFNKPRGVAVDAAGNVYVADTGNFRIRKVTPDGVVSTLAGAGALGFADGQAAEAKFNQPRGLTVDAAGNVYVADTDNHRIRKIAPDGLVSTIAGNVTAGLKDGTGADAAFNSPYSLAADASGNLYVADSFNNAVRKVTPDGRVSTVAGGGAKGYADGTGAAARFNYPLSVAVDGANHIYVADFYNHRVRRITSGGEVTTVAGDSQPGLLNGMGTQARFNGPYGVAVAADALIVADTSNHVLRRIQLR